jgi:hypothetical protein
VIRQEHERLIQLFALLLAAGCTTKDMPPADGAANEDSTLGDVATTADATMETEPADAGEDSFCKMVIVSVLDAAADGDAEADPPCEYTFPCGLTDGTVGVGCELYAPGNGPLDARAFGCWLQENHGCVDGQAVPPDGPTVVDCRDCLGGAGRATAGVATLEAVRAKSTLAAWFAKMAHDEAASIWAFERFERELRRHRAPRELVRAARSARRDEIRHAKMMSAHARALGAELRAPRIRKSRRVRGLEAIARENAVEGGVRETFAALLATWQAANAPAEYRETFAAIAADETRHAALAQAAGRWMDARLSPRARARVRTARRRAAEAWLARPSVAAVVRRFFGDDDVVHVALAKTLRGDAHEA